MPNDVAHFAIHADDYPRAKQFYERVLERAEGRWRVVSGHSSTLWS